MPLWKLEFDTCVMSKLTVAFKNLLSEAECITISGRQAGSDILSKTISPTGEAPVST